MIGINILRTSVNTPIFSPYVELLIVVVQLWVLINAHPLNINWSLQEGMVKMLAVLI